MKKVTKRILLIAMGITLLNGCTDLEEQPEGLLSPESFFSNEVDFEAALVGNYRSYFGGWGGFDFVNAFVMNGGAEDMSSRPPAFNLNQYDRFLTQPSAGAHSAMWNALYAGIANSNNIISNIGNLEGVVSAERKDEIEGQARFLRALGYFYLVRWFGEVPIITSENQTDADVVGQSPVADIYNLIVSDLSLAENQLPPSFAEAGKAPRGAAKALLAKVYLTMAGWPLEDTSNYALARDKANELISGNLAGTYSLEEDFADLWLVDNKLNNSEFIFSFFGASNGEGSKFHHSSRPGVEGGWSDWYSEDRFFNAFPDDYRKDISFHTVFLDGTAWEDGEFQQPYIAKFRDGGVPCGPGDGGCGGAQGDFGIPILRYAEVLLIYAEAANMAEGSPSASALEAINQVRRRANNLDSNTPDASVDLTAGISQGDFDDAVIAERAWELAFEHKRWFDLVRKKMVVEVNQDLHPNVTENNRLLPKPATEVDLIEGLEQNPGY
ncbi:RagB/SusD family nutrient uptake outer membrane protein [Maribacter sp. 2304DJ31-5]|uniref:RagB/SusD family nutrient uptake outer membrane protein n=1 Tax=Maribacter sp. 2304DJ31-5 TaxID=3386273 RepID=UPI0039BD89AE